ncbi:hypothetical protein TRFO_10479 [Tritrichomonas foetus]|uniref:BRCT domain-containing protein n=1 Tax=Tritrichomonas foetus TaxID=1144522 RepID=A0A1J4J8R5_9EUKA|nr:hypothetical protein TRFO_10479 [Tritrichomonas foetus]|eukprot:OHS95574.1 hypothetical protein TRFO_10479 [Tritrichomonas foetus]
MRANVILSKGLTIHDNDLIREALRKLKIEIDEENSQSNLPKVKIVNNFYHIAFDTPPECLTVTPLVLKQLIADKYPIKNLFDLQKYGLCFNNLYLFSQKIGFAKNIPDDYITRLIQMVPYMGGQVVNINDFKINYIITYEKCDNPHKALLVLPSWLESLFHSPIYLEPSPFEIPDISINVGNNSFDDDDDEFQSKTQDVYSNKTSNSNIGSLKLQQIRTRGLTSSQPSRGGIRKERMITKMVSNSRRKLEICVDMKQTTLPFPPSISPTGSVSGSGLSQKSISNTQINSLTHGSSITSSPQITNSQLPKKPKTPRKPTRKSDVNSQKIDDFITLRKRDRSDSSSQISAVDSQSSVTSSQSLSKDSSHCSQRRQTSIDEVYMQPSQLKIFEESPKSSKSSTSLKQKSQKQQKLITLQKFDKSNLQKPSKTGFTENQEEIKKPTILKKLSDQPPIFDAMIEDTQISSDDMSDENTSSVACPSPNRTKKLNDLCNSLIINGSRSSISEGVSNSSSFTLNDLNSFSQMETLESQSAIFYNVEYDRDRHNEESQHSGITEKDPLIELYETSQPSQNE